MRRQVIARASNDGVIAALLFVWVKSGVSTKRETRGRADEKRGERERTEREQTWAGSEGAAYLHGVGVLSERCSF